jgi:hypothetical protein
LENSPSFKPKKNKRGGKKKPAQNTKPQVSPKVAFAADLKVQTKPFVLAAVEEMKFEETPNTGA